MVKKSLPILILLAFSMVLLAQQSPEKKPEPPSTHEYVGAKMCNMCHKKEAIGETWEQSPHAKAFDVLSKARQKDKDCLKCHSTGSTARGHLLKGVQCEACHGPGSDYKSLKVMKNRDMALAHGLILGNEMTCRKCHLDTLPEVCNLTEKFDFKKMMAKGIHRLPSKAPQK